MFISRLGVSYRIDGDVVRGRFVAGDYTRVPETRLVRAGVLVTVADVVAGWGANRVVFPRIPLTLDLTVRRLRPIEAGDGAEMDITARVLKAGVTTVVSEVVFADAASGEAVVMSHATFINSPRPEDEFTEPLPARTHPSSLTRPIMQDIGASVVAPGVAQLARVPYVLQPAGTIQGGAVGLLAELAAESFAAAPIADLELRYLATIRIGPAVATASAVSPDLVRVEVRDAGRPERLAALAMARPAFSRTAAR